VNLQVSFKFCNIIDLLDLIEGSEKVNQGIQNADLKSSSQEIINDILQIKKFIQTANFSRALSLLQNKLVNIFLLNNKFKDE